MKLDHCTLHRHGFGRNRTAARCTSVISFETGPLHAAQTLSQSWQGLRNGHSGEPEGFVQCWHAFGMRSGVARGPGSIRSLATFGDPFGIGESGGENGATVPPCGRVLQTLWSFSQACGRSKAPEVWQASARHRCRMLKSAQQPRWHSFCLRQRCRRGSGWRLAPLPPHSTTLPRA